MPQATGNENAGRCRFIKKQIKKSCAESGRKKQVAISLVSNKCGRQVERSQKMSSKSVHLCFCSLCEGKTLQSGYKIKQHAKLYGTLSTAKKSRLAESDSSTTSTSDDEKNEYVEDATIFAMGEEYDNHDDVVYGNDLSLLAEQNKLVLVKVRSCYKSFFSSQ